MISKSQIRRLKIQGAPIPNEEVVQDKMTPAEKIKLMALIIFVIIVAFICIYMGTANGQLPEKLATSKVLVSWQPSANSDIHKYNIYVDTVYLISVIHPDTSIALQLDSIMVRYYQNIQFNVTAEDSTGNESPMSNTVDKLLCKEMGKLYCDVDGDGSVINIDYFLMLRKLGNHVSIEDTMLQVFDFNGDTLINNIDFAIMLKRLGNRK